ncbi:peptidoglycan-binding domain-containing protein [Dyella silvae]|uniref:peptidoglycan-binding domain-containing protein n=1 Tax=Dyella silvae TaxID=2994424 RepID=UPI0022653373|nr:peptidoglycan-binding domain-containing protein [Dyella silvae]
MGVHDDIRIGKLPSADFAEMPEPTTPVPPGCVRLRTSAGEWRILRLPTEDELIWGRDPDGIDSEPDPAIRRVIEEEGARPSSLIAVHKSAVRDALHDLQLLRDLEIINARTAKELGPLPKGGLPVQVKRKPISTRPGVVMANEPQEQDAMKLSHWAAAAALSAGTLTTGVVHGAESTIVRVADGTMDTYQALKTHAQTLGDGVNRAYDATRQTVTQSLDSVARGLDAVSQPIHPPAPHQDGPHAAMPAPALDVATVRSLQTHLNTLGLTDHRGQRVVESGVYDPTTRMAVIGFQHEHGLPTTGLPDKATLSLVQTYARLTELQPTSAERAMPSREAAALAPTPSHVPAKQMPTPSHDQTTTSLGLGYAPNDPRHRDNPNHALYNQLHERIPEASERRLLQFTAACHASGITNNNLKDIHLNETKGAIAFGSGGLITHVASVDLKAPMPTPEQAVQQIQQYDQYQAQVQEHIQAMNAQRHAQAQHGPMLGGR